MSNSNVVFLLLAASLASEFYRYFGTLCSTFIGSVGRRNHPKVRKQNSEHSESLKSRMIPEFIDKVVSNKYDAGFPCCIHLMHFMHIWQNELQMTY
jgi:hypothetical protein